MKNKRLVVGPNGDPDRFEGYGLVVDRGGVGTMFAVWDLACDPPVLRGRRVYKIGDYASDGDPTRLLEYLTEMSVRLADIRHPAILSPSEPYVASYDSVCVLLPYVDGKDFECWALQEQSVARRVAALRSIAGGLAALHASGVKHCDIHPLTIVVGSECSSVLFDYGLAHVSSDRAAFPLLGGYHPRHNYGTATFRAPETQQGDQFSVRSDLYMFAATLFFGITLSGPPRLFDKRYLEAAIGSALRWDPELRILVACLDPEPSRRPVVNPEQLVEVTLSCVRTR